MCILSPLGAFFPHCFKQTRSTVLGMALAPFSSCDTESRHLTAQIRSTPLGYCSELQAPFCAPQVTGGSLCLKASLKMEIAREFAPAPATNSSEKKLAYLYFHFLQPDILTYSVAKAQKLQHKLVLSCFLPFSLRCFPLTSIVQAIFSSSWGVVLKK